MLGEISFLKCFLHEKHENRKKKRDKKRQKKMFFGLYPNTDQGVHSHEKRNSKRGKRREIRRRRTHIPQGLYSFKHRNFLKKVFQI